jgi:hypothetical protein
MGLRLSAHLTPSPVRIRFYAERLLMPLGALKSAQARGMPVHDAA